MNVQTHSRQSEIPCCTRSNLGNCAALVLQVTAQRITPHMSPRIFFNYQILRSINVSGGYYGEVSVVTDMYDKIVQIGS
jgi:hypothetical protein